MSWMLLSFLSEKIKNPPRFLLLNSYCKLLILEVLQSQTQEKAVISLIILFVSEKIWKFHADFCWCPRKHRSRRKINILPLSAQVQARTQENEDFPKTCIGNGRGTGTSRFSESLSKRREGRQENLVCTNITLSQGRRWGKSGSSQYLVKLKVESRNSRFSNTCFSAWKGPRKS